MDHLAGARRNLMVVERSKNVLRIAAIDPAAVAVEHEHIDEVRILVDPAMIASVERSISADNPISGSRGEIDPYLIGICSALGKQMPHPEAADDNLQQIGFPRFECGE